MTRPGPWAFLLTAFLACAPGFAGEWDNDPVPGLTDAEAARCAGTIPDALADEILEAAVGRAQTAYTARHPAPDGFLAWLAAHPDIRRAFWLALHPTRDDIPAAMKVLDDLRLQEPEKTVDFFHLAVAFAVVWDTPRAVQMSQRACIYAVRPEQFPPLMGYLAAFRYFTDKARIKRFLFDPAELVWPILVHLVDFDVTLEEAEWALAKFEKQKKTVGGVYSQVQYDDGKREGRPPKLGANPYTLPNLLTFGGVCGDQAHFCSRVAKCLGVPAMKAAGLGRYGGAGHAFVCYFVLKKNRPVLDSTGRYYSDFYYTGDIFDPQTGREILDRTVAMMLDGASLSYSKYMLSLALTRLAEKEYAARPEASLALTKKAITTNYFCAPSWRLLMGRVKEGAVKPDEGLDWANTMMKYLGEHPDLTFECFSTFLACIPADDVKRRQGFYNRVAAVYEERPDLLLLLKEAQGKELVDAGKEADAAGVWLLTLAEQGKEGRLLMPLLEPCVDILSRNPKMLPRALPYLEKMVRRFPKSRMGETSEAFRKVAKMVVPLFETGGDKKEADKIRRQAGI